MTRSIWHPQPVERLKADVCVVGAGIMGSSTAFWLSRLAPDTDVLLLDARWPAYGASGRNAGFLLQGAATDYKLDHLTYGRQRALRLRAFTQENRDLLVDCLDAAAFSFQPTGTMTVAGDPDEERRLEESAAMLREDGYPGDFLPAAELNRRLGSRDYLGGLYVASGGMLDPVQLVEQLAGRSGARLRTRSRVTGVGSGRVEGDGFEVEAGAIVVTAGPWVSEIIPAAADWVRPVRAQMAALRPSGPVRVGLPVYSHQGYYYLRPHPDGSILLGGARHLHVEEEQGFEDRTTEQLQQDLLAYAGEHFEGLALARRERSWSGVMGFSPDGLPVMERIDDGLFCATGFTGHGMAYGFRTGRLLAAWARGKSDPDQDLFSASRLRALTDGASNPSWLDR